MYYKLQDSNEISKNFRFSSYIILTKVASGFLKSKIYFEGDVFFSIPILPKLPQNLQKYSPKLGFALKADAILSSYDMKYFSDSLTLNDHLQLK